MHRSEAEGRFGEAEPEGRASVCAEPSLRAIGVEKNSTELLNGEIHPSVLGNGKPPLRGSVLVSHFDRTHEVVYDHRGEEHGGSPMNH